MADVKWIKLMINVFDNRKIKQIECLPDGDGMIVIWLKLLCLAGNVNDDGMIYFTDEMPYTDEMLAKHFNRDITLVRFALQTFESFGMIEIVDDIIKISNWEKYQNVEGMDRIREQTRKRVAKHREKQKLLSDGCNVTVTLRNATEEERRKKKEDIDTYYVSIVEYLNKVAGTLFKSGTAATRTKIRARLNEGFTVEDFKTVIDKKCSQWLNDKKMRKFIRPETLFGTKFESYLNEKSDVNIKSSQDDDMDAFLKEMDLI